MRVLVPHAAPFGFRYPHRRALVCPAISPSRVCPSEAFQRLRDPIPRHRRGGRRWELVVKVQHVDLALRSRWWRVAHGCRSERLWELIYDCEHGLRPRAGY